MIDSFEVKYRKIPVKVLIKGKTGIRDFIFIVDTGASHSIINAALLKSIGYLSSDYCKSENLMGFGGNSIKIDFLETRSIFCLGLKRSNFVIGVHDFKLSTFYDGILGVDFFLNHKLSIDFKNGIIELI